MLSKLSSTRLRVALPRAGLVLLAVALPWAAMAQDAAPATKTNPDKDATAAEEVVRLETFTVSGGFSGSLAAAAEAKQASPTIVEVIMSEDIGKLPDVSIADSLTRLTGLTTQRVNGRSQGISIRGLTGDFSTGLLNGREQVSTSLNRTVEFDQYPAELQSSVVVYKTGSANLIGQGLAGTIDLQTVRPLEKSGRTIAVNGYYKWTELGLLTPGVKKDGNSAAISYIDQFSDGKVGIALGFAHTSTPFEGQQFQAWGYPTDSAGNFALGGTKSYVRSSQLDRDGFMGVFEFKPSNYIHTTVDIYTSSFEEKQLLRGLEIPMAYWSSAQIQPGYTVTNGLITQATLTNVQPVVRNDIFDGKDDLFAAGWNLKIGDGSAWTTVFDVGYSKVTRNNQNLETYSGLGFRQTPFGSADTMTVKLIPGQIPVIKSTVDYTNTSLFRLTDPQGWGPTTLPGGGMYGYLKYFQSKDELGQVKLSTEHEMKRFFFSKVEFGVSYSDRYKRDGEKPTGWMDSPTGQVTLPLPATIGTTDMSFLGLGGVYAYDPIAAYSSGTIGFFPNNDLQVIARHYDIREKLTRGYVQFNIDHKLGGVPVTGNIGGQVINVDQSSRGYSTNGTTLTPVSDGAKYTDFAPSMNLNFKVATQTYVRFSLARQIARPRMYDMKAGRSFGYDPTLASSTDLSHSPWSSGESGNPRLKPWKSDSIDLAFDKYFKDSKGYVSLAAFHKKLLSYIYTQSVLQDFTGYPTNGTTPALSQGTASAPANGSGGSIKGLEFTLSLPSELISSSVKGFGIVLNGAYTDSTIRPWGPTGGTAPISGLSRKVANVTLYYERAGFSVRVSERYRSEYRAYITTFGPPNPSGDANPNGGYSLAQAEKVVDAQISYSLQSGSLRGLTFYLQAYNLNDEPLVTYNNGDPRQVQNYQKYGASYSAGASYKF